MPTQQAGLWRDWSRDWGGILVIALAALVVSSGFWVGSGPGSNRDLLWTVELGAVLCGLGAVLLSLRAGRQLAGTVQQRRVWYLLAMAFALVMAGDLVSLFEVVHFRYWPVPSVADLFHMGYYVTLLYGVISSPITSRSGGDRVRLWLDTGTVLLGGAMLAGYVLSGLALVTKGSGDLAAVIAYVYPIGDLLLFFGITFRAFVHRAQTTPGSLTFLAAGQFFFVASDTVFWFMTSHGIPSGRPWFEILRAAGLVCAAAAAQYYCWRIRLGDKVAPPGDVPLWLPGSLPYAGVLLAHLLVLDMARRHAAAPVLQMLLAGSTAITVVVIFRQIYMLRQNARLLAESDALAQGLQSSEARFRSLVQNAFDAIMIVDGRARLRYMSGSARRVFGYKPEDLWGNDLTTFVHPDDLAYSLQTVDATVRAPESVRMLQFRFRHADGSWRWAETVVSNMVDDPNVGGLVLNTRDITERYQLEGQLRHQAFHDALTNLGNRTLFRDRVEHALVRLRRTGGGLAVLFLDLDGFKYINDSLGHSAGDELLVSVAGRLQVCVRSADTVARMGGDEFAILLEDGDASRAEQVAQRIVQGLQAPFYLKDRPVTIHASIGIAAVTDGRTDTVEELLRNADVAMYMAKERGKGTFVVFEPQMHTMALERLERETALRRAVDNGEFVLHYQPVIDLKSGQIRGAEALVRWRRPEGGLISPGEFIPLAEETGLILPLGLWVLREACRQAREWQNTLTPGETFEISVNLSVHQLEQPGFVAEVADALQANGLAPESLTLEITETVLLQAGGRGQEVLRSLKALGVHLAIDDFGTGYSSLAYLRRFPVDIVKIDRSFVDGVGRGDREAALARGIIDLVHALDLQTVAEGVERADQLEELKALQCGQGQGFLFARPLESSALTLLLTGR